MRRWIVAITLALGLAVVGAHAQDYYRGSMSGSVNGIVTTSTDGYVLQNATPATAGVPVQMSPRLRWTGNAWDTAASETVSFFVEVLPATAATPTGAWKLGYSLNGAAATYPMTLGSDGSLTILGAITAGGSTSQVSSLSVVNNLTTGNQINSTQKYAVNGTLWVSGTAPTIASGFGTSPSVAASNGTAAFTVNVGTGGVATAGVITMPAAPTRWNCAVNNETAAAAHVAYNTRQTAATTTTVTIENQTTSTGAAIAWSASSILTLICAGL